ncbi:PH domain-containing protein, partial [Bacteroides thetaiotaomicron]
LIGIFHRDDLVSIIRERVETNKRKKGIYEITNH